MKNIVKSIPIIGSVAKLLYRKLINPTKAFTTSKNYWVERYANDGNSGNGSYGKYAEYKSEVINKFVKKEGIKTIIEYGSGDGNQLKLSDYPKYTGFDVSPIAISQCRKLFANDNSKTFKLIEEYEGEKAQLTLSLEVIFHLVEDEIFLEHMNKLFESSEMFVIIFSSNTDKISNDPHVRHRNFSAWINENRPNWNLYERIPNKYPYNEETGEGGFSDFYIYKLGA
ncbi:MAG: hypothetical protein KJ571_08595 [Bacteroidetes bacterium]|nr:hypothetical protein [Bacteroidota bacterium]